jgi:hypothetical protein
MRTRPERSTDVTNLETPKAGIRMRSCGVGVCGFLLLLFLGLLVLRCQLFSGNRPPVITGFYLSDTVIKVTGYVNAVCEASDPDGDTLHFSWTCTRGSVSSDSMQATTWYPSPDTGICVLKVVVTDGSGGEASKSRSIRVLPWWGEMAASRVLHDLGVEAGIHHLRPARERPL